MSEHGAPAIKPADDPAFKLPPTLAALWKPMCIGGAVALVVGWLIGCNAVDGRFGMSVYLTSFMYCMTIVLGCLFFVLIQHLSRAGWSTVVRRVAELGMMMVIPLAILFLPVLVTLYSDNGLLYNWDDPTYAEEHHLPEQAWTAKTTYWLSQGWFTVRAMIYLAIWAGLAIYFFRNSIEQDRKRAKRRPPIGCSFGAGRR